MMRLVCLLFGHVPCGGCGYLKAHHCLRCGRRGLDAEGGRS